MIELYKSSTVLYQASEVAGMLGCSIAQVSRLCQKMDAPKLGKFYLINEELLADLKARNTKVGRPKASKQ